MTARSYSVLAIIRCLHSIFPLRLEYTPLFKTISHISRFVYFPPAKRIQSSNLPHATLSHHMTPSALLEASSQHHSALPIPRIPPADERANLMYEVCFFSIISPINISKCCLPKNSLAHETQEHGIFENVILRIN